MIKALFLHPLGPSLILILGGLLFIPLRQYGRAAERAPGRWGLTFAYLPVLLAGSLLAYLRARDAAVAPLSWLWQPLTTAGGSLSWRMDGWNWFAGLLVLLATAATLALQDDPGRDPASPQRAGRTLWLAAAALAFVFSDNLLTLATCWFLLDAALVWRLLPGASALPAGRTWTLLSLTGLLLVAALIFQGAGHLQTPLTARPVSGPVLALLWFAALVRGGIYPFHLWLAGPRHMDGSDQAALYVVGPTTGIWLLARVQELGGPAWARQPEWAALGALALFGTALAAWVATDNGTAWRWIAINRASLAVLAAFLASTTGPAALLWPLAAFTLGASLLALGQRLQTRWGWSLVAWFGALAVWGLPGTPGFLAQSALAPLAQNSSASAQWPLFGLVLIAECLMAAALWHVVVGDGPFKGRPATARVRLAISLAPMLASVALAGGLPPGSTAARLAPVGKAQAEHAANGERAWALLQVGFAIVVVAVPMIAWGLQPRVPAILAGLRPASGLPWTFSQALTEARGWVWVSLVTAGLTGALLGWLRPYIFKGMRGWQQGILTVVSLEWVYEAGTLLLQIAGSGLQYFARLGEGEGYMGWLILAAVMLWMLFRS